MSGKETRRRAKPTPFDPRRRVGRRPRPPEVDGFLHVGRVGEAVGKGRRREQAGQVVAHRARRRDRRQVGRPLDPSLAGHRPGDRDQRQRPGDQDETAAHRQGQHLARSPRRHAHALTPTPPAPRSRGAAAAAARARPASRRAGRRTGPAAPAPRRAGAWRRRRRAAGDQVPDRERSQGAVALEVGAKQGGGGLDPAGPTAAPSRPGGRWTAASESRTSARAAGARPRPSRSAGQRQMTERPAGRHPGLGQVASEPFLELPGGGRGDQRRPRRAAVGQLEQQRRPVGLGCRAGQRGGKRLRALRLADRR